MASVFIAETKIIEMSVQSMSRKKMTSPGLSVNQQI